MAWHYWSTISCHLVCKTVFSFLKSHQVYQVLDGYFNNGGDSKRRSLDRMAKRWPWPLCRDLTYNNLFNFCNQDFDYWFVLNREWPLLK